MSGYVFYPEAFAAGIHRGCGPSQCFTVAEIRDSLRQSFEAANR